MQLPLALRMAGPAARPHAGRLAGAAGLVVLQVGLTLLRPWPLALAVDYALTPQRPGPGQPLLASWPPLVVLAVAAGAMVSVGGLLGLLDMGLEQTSEGAAQRIGAELRAQVFARAVSRSLRWHDRIGSGELLSRLTTDVGRLLDAVVVATTVLVPDVVMLVGVLVLVLGIDPGLAVVGISVGPVLAWLSVRQRRRVRSAQGSARHESGRLVGTAGDLLRNVRALQAFGRTGHANRILGDRNAAVLDAELDAVDVQARWMPIPELVLALGAAAVLVVGGRHVLAGTLTVGELLVVSAYLRDLYTPIRGLTRLSHVLAKAEASAVRISAVLDCQEAVRTPDVAVVAPPLRTGVHLEDVRFGYDPARPVLRGVDLHVAAGERVCLVGPSGSGKSTVLQLLLRLYDVDAGRVLLDGVDVRECDLTSLRSRFAYLPQEPWLLDATLAENIALGDPTASRAEIVAAARTALVHEFVGRLPHGYDTRLGESGVRLSGGERRRVALARATISGAPMVLLDEPTTSLDPDAAAGVLRAIERTTRGRTTLAVTHDPAVASLADRVVDLTDLLATTTVRTPVESQRR